MIDAHHHFWRLDRGDYHWLTPKLTSLYRDFLPEHFDPIIEQHKILGTVLVQAAESEKETEFLLELASQNSVILGVVGWVDLMSPNVGDRLDRLLRLPGGSKLKAIRPMIQEIEDVDWIVSTELDAGFNSLVERNLVFEALVQPIHLSNLRLRLDRHPLLRVVIDHGAKPYIAAHERSRWCAHLDDLAQNPNVYCKLSGLVTEAGQDWVEADLRPYMADIFYNFGPSRVLWGSDWPVLHLASDYETWLRISQTYCAKFSSEEQAHIFGQNAVDVYGLDVSSTVASEEAETRSFKQGEASYV